MNLAAIDIGTNSIRLLLCRKKKNNFETIKRRLETPRLGAGAQDDHLTTLAIKRSIKVLREYMQEAKEAGAEIIAIATSAVREAENKEEFLTKVKTELGIDIKVISGQKEAQISYQGMVEGFKKLPDDILTIDIGGGSTELIYGDQKKCFDYNSFKIGAIRLTKEFGESFRAMENKVQKALKPYLNNKKVEQLLGAGGTITTLAAIKNSLAEYDHNLIHGYKLTKEDIIEIFTRLKKLSLAERKQVVGLNADRADIILAGIIILEVIMYLIGIDEIIVSDQGLLEGVVYSYHKLKSKE